jgi:hypothetical protein
MFIKKVIITATNKPLNRNNAGAKLLIKGTAFAAFSGRPLGVINIMKPTFQTNPYYRIICFLLGVILLYAFLNYHTDNLIDYYIALFVSLSIVLILLVQSIYIEEFIFQNDQVVYQKRYFIWVKIILIIPYREIQRIEKIENIQRITNYKISYCHDSNTITYNLTIYKLLLYYLIRPNFDFIFQEISIKANKPIEYKMI